MHLFYHSITWVDGKKWVCVNINAFVCMWQLSQTAPESSPLATIIDYLFLFFCGFPKRKATDTHLHEVKQKSWLLRSREQETLPLGNDDTSHLGIAFKISSVLSAFIVGTGGQHIHSRKEDLAGRRGDHLSWRYKQSVGFLCSRILVSNWYFHSQELLGKDSETVTYSLSIERLFQWQVSIYSSVNVFNCT